MLPQEEKPDPYEDIEKYEKWVENNVRTKLQREQEAKRSQQIEESRSKMFEQHADFGEMEKIFGIMVATDDSLMDKMLNSPDPVVFAYNQAKEYKSSLLSPAEVKKEPSEAELRNAAALKEPNLATATAQARNTPQLENEEDLDDVFADVGYLLISKGEINVKFDN